MNDCIHSQVDIRENFPTSLGSETLPEEVKDCFNCGWFLFLGNTSKGVCICLRHKIQIEPNPALRCDHWRRTLECDFHYDDIYVNDAVERTKQENAADLYHKE